MILGTNEKLAELIIHCFRRQPQLSQREIFSQLRTTKKVSERAVFKELAKLVEQGILVRVKGRYAVKVTWILELLELGDDLTKQSLHRKSLDIQVPEPGGRLRWKFNDLRRMDAFWVQLMFVLFSISKRKQMYVWSPHFWFHLLDLKKELQAMRAMKTGGNKHFLIIGSDSYLDKLPARYWNKHVYDWSYAVGPFEGEDRRYIDVIDDYVLTVLFTPQFVKELDALLDRVRNEHDLQKIDLNTFFNKRTMVTLTLENNPAKAKRLTKKFKEFFGHT
jgi:hypothetical protein